jgi:ABC-2 type transport system permease protein
MTTQASSTPDFPLDPQPAQPAAMTPTRPFYWSVKREIWEHRSIYMAPLAAAGVCAVGFLISLCVLPKSIRSLSGMSLERQHVELAMPFAHVGMLIVLTAVLVSVLYCLDALHGERRDRSILFWKSLPVSDLTTVLAKASVPLVIMPVLAIAISVALQVIMFFVSCAFLGLHVEGAGQMWAVLPLFQMEVVLVYGVTAITLWYAPIYCWLLLVSGWARRAAFLWAVLPPAAIAIFEAVAFRTGYFHRLMSERFIGFASLAFNLTLPDGSMVDAHYIPLAQITPGRFLSSPGLWVGLMVAAGFLVAAVRLRRYREPI